ncbi:sulfur reduction protein DsrE [Winogradskyella sp. Asnod2-B02-A]|uniref:DsrE family protein n=1 Tax=Winogradskyella sp. Asnod2-B02-A TaxID=3160583 RepID=UPI003869F764
MKKIFFTSALLLFTFFTSAHMQAQHSQKNEKNNYVVLTKKIPQLQPIILTAEALKAEEGKDFGNFEVIICGQNIGDITDSEKINKFIEKAKKAGVQIVACGFSLDKFKIDRASVPDDIKIVENGILYNFQLQKQDYKNLSL